MVVLITNITDAAKEGAKLRPTGVRIFNKELRPGTSLRVDARFVDVKMRKLEEAGYISIGKVPPWYQDYKERRKTRAKLSADDVIAQLKAVREKAEAQKLWLAKKKGSKAASKPEPSKSKTPPKAMSFGLSDSVSIPTDEIKMDEVEEPKGRKKKRS